jgi:hypothetical protein
MDKSSVFKNAYLYTSKIDINMSLLNQQNNKGKKKGDKKSKSPDGKGSKFIQKPKSGFVSKQANTGSQRGS